MQSKLRKNLKRKCRKMSNNNEQILKAGNDHKVQIGQTLNLEILKKGKRRKRKRKQKMK